MYVCVCVCVCMCVCMYICIYILCVYVYTYVCIYLYTDSYIRTLHTYLCIRAAWAPQEMNRTLMISVVKTL